MSGSEFPIACSRRTILRAGSAAVLLASTGCSNFIPSSGPRIAGVVGPASQTAGAPGPASDPALRYALLTLDSAIVSGL